MVDTQRCVYCIRVSNAAENSDTHSSASGLATRLGLDHIMHGVKILYIVVFSQSPRFSLRMVS